MYGGCFDSLRYILLKKRMFNIIRKFFVSRRKRAAVSKAILLSFMLLSLVVSRTNLVITSPTVSAAAGTFTIAAAHADDSTSSDSNISSDSSDNSSKSGDDMNGKGDNGDNNQGNGSSTPVYYPSSTPADNGNHDGGDDNNHHDECDDSSHHHDDSSFSGYNIKNDISDSNHDNDNNCVTKLTVIVNVVNAGGGTNSASDFTVHVTGTNATPASFSGSATGTLVTLGNGTYAVTEASSTNYTTTFSADCSGTASANSVKTCTITDTFNGSTGGGGGNPGSITICKVIENASGTIVDGSAFPGQTFAVAGIATVPSSTPAGAGLLPTATFATPLSLNTKLFGYAAANNAQCVNYSGLALGHWYYGTESLATSSEWATPKYNDQDTVTASSLANFFSYSPELFDATSSNDAARNTNADGDINLTASRPTRQLIVLNQFIGTAPTSTPTSTVPSADISIAKTVDNANPSEGGTINYTLTVKAFGPATSTGVVASDTLPAGLTFVSATSTAGTFSTSTGTWTLGNMAASSSANLVLTATVNTGTAGQTITNVATVSENASTTDPNSSNNTASVPVTVAGGTGGGGGTPSADISIVKTANVTSTTEGGAINYTLTVTALGPSTSTGVVATDTLPAGLTFVHATTSRGTFSSSTGVWTIGDMAPSSTATLTIAAQANAGTAGQTITNTADVLENASTTDPNPGNNTSNVPVTVGTPTGGGGGGPVADISVTKSVDASNPSEGQTINYTVTVSALGPVTSTGVVASDVLPAGLTFVHATTSLGSFATSTGTWTLGDMTPSSSATLVLTATVNAGQSGQTITNTATVSENATTTDPNPSNNTASVPVTVAVGGGGGGGGGNPPTEGCGNNCPTVGVGGGGTPIPPGGGGGGGGTVLGTSTTSTPPGVVLGASCGIYLREYIHPIRKDLNNPDEVRKLQIFLNQNLGLSLAVNGDYNDATIAAVNQFQTKYHIEVLAPWVPHGLPNEFTPTSYVYKTTQRWINLIMCSDLNLPIPPLP